MTTNTIISDYPRLLAVAVGLPFIICVLDYLLIWTGGAHHIVLPFVFVAQVGILGICTGRYVDNAFLRCVIFVWSMALVDSVALVTMFFGQGMTMQCMTFALLSGQIGVLTTWGSLGRMPWPWRIPIFLVILSLAVVVVMRSSDDYRWIGQRFELWAVILAMQGVMMLLLCSTLSSVGYRLVPLVTEPENAADWEDAGFRFSIRHLVFWMTIVCPVLVLAKGLDWLFLDRYELFRTAVLGMSMAVVSWTAMWSALGHGRQLLRFLSLLFAPPIVGAWLTWFTSRWIVTWGATPAAWLFRPLKEMGLGWGVWTVLAAWFLASLLLVFRSAGYRLLRTQNHPDAAAPASPNL